MKVHCLSDKLVHVNDLVPHPKNRNSHPDDQIKRLAQILAFQGWRYPVKVSKRSGFVTSGHGRIEAAKVNGWTQVPVNFQDYDSDEQEYADVQADNAIAAWSELDLSGINTDLGELGPDFDIDLLGLKEFELVIGDTLEPQCDEDEVPEHVEPRTKLGDIYQLGRHRLMCGDSTNTDNVMALFAGAKAELCFTSPPYADQREYNGEKELSTEFLATFIRAAYGVAKYFAVNLGYARKNGEVSPYWDDYLKEAKDCGLRFLSWNIWDKGECGSIGNQTAMFGISHEWIFVFGPETKKLNRTVPNKSAGDRANHTGNRQRDGSIKKSKECIIGDFSQMKTVYACTAQKARDEIDHPARFPVEFPEGYIEAMTDPSDTVYEPFGGSGTTLIAAEKTGRSCLIMELDPQYADVIVARWEKYTGKKAELLSG